MVWNWDLVNIKEELGNMQEREEIDYKEDEYYESLKTTIDTYMYPCLK